MEKLTIRDIVAGVEIFDLKSDISEARAFDLLGRYEDTGFTPDEIKCLNVLAEGLEKRANEAESQLSKAVALLELAHEDIYRQCSNCAHWAPGLEIPKKCKVGGCLNILNPDKWQWQHITAMQELGIEV